MKYVWNTPHADLERLPERSSFSKTEVEARLDEARYTINTHHNGAGQNHHLIWDPGISALIAVPVDPVDDEVFYIPTILPVNYGNGIAEWQRAAAEHAWLRNDYFFDQAQGPSFWSDRVAEFWLAKTWIKRSGWSGNRDIKLLTTWQLFGLETKGGEQGMLALFRNKAFRTEAKRLIERELSNMQALCDDDTPVIHLKCPGAHRHIPIEFFLKTP